MIWSQTHFPAAMRSLTPSVRAKAIEIANSLLEQGGLDKHDVILTSICEARSWARRRITEADGMRSQGVWDDRQMDSLGGQRQAVS
ncbi:hypothetical protein [Larkinella soli]|uniref:hypothetical protein n=1 Tax=Larkinella soli TaxID=1770527 RepID=UPI000FFB8114|nr:hypothetical protein [Larkinella soli]